MKKLLSLFILALLPLMASADAVEIDGIYYNLVDKAKQAEVTKNPKEYSGEVVVPESVGYGGITYSVTSIGEWAFSHCRNLTSVTIPNSVMNIKSAFEGCDGLTSVHISDLEAWCNISFSDSDKNSNPLYYAHHLFLNGEEIKDLVIPNSVISIGKRSFMGGSNLTSITIPNSVTSIGEDAFYGCSGLTSVTIPNSVTSIGGYAFYGCTGLKSVTIPNGITSIDYCVFEGCSSLTSVTIPNSVTSIGSYAFASCIGLTSVTIPNSVLRIQAWAFQGCSGLTSITIGNSVNFINEEAFSQCKNLNEVYCYAPIVPRTNNDAFNESYIEYATLHVPESALEDYKAANPWSGFKEFIALPNFKLTYLVDGEVYKIYKYEEDRPIPREREPYKEGCTFSGWSDIPEVMPAHDVEVTGTFTVNQYKLIYIVDGEEYKSYDINYGATITPEEYPSKVGYTFSGWSEIPETMPAYDVWVYGNFEKNSLGQCAVPKINYDNGKLSFSCETEDVEFFYDIRSLDSKSGSGETVTLTNTYLITVYATKEGYDNSETATAEIHLSTGLSGDTNGDGVINAADIVEIVKIIMNAE